MASIRNLKKDIDFLVFEVISDCFTVMSVQPLDKSDELAEVVADAVKFRNELFSRVKHSGGKNNPELTKAYYKKIKLDLLEGIDALFERLSKITKKKSAK